MDIVIIIGAVVLALLFILQKIKRKPRKRPLKMEEVPTYLGFHPYDGRKMVKDLDLAFSSTYKSNVKKRLLEENPNWSENDYRWRLFELKRYFVMNALLKSVPMFSAEVDKVWHEMLMFTKDYERFSHKYYGETLHHIPNMEVEPIPDDRAFFDWVYLSLFKPTTNSNLLWSGFLRNPLNEETLQDFKMLSDEALLQKYFRESSQWRQMKLYLIHKLRSEIKQANGKLAFPRVKSERDLHLLLPTAVFFSLHEREDYTDNIVGLMPSFVQKASQSSNSGCSGFACSSSSDSDSGGGSSCSSCGGGCSS